MKEKKNNVRICPISRRQTSYVIWTYFLLFFLSQFKKNKNIYKIIFSFYKKYLFIKTLFIFNNERKNKIITIEWIPWFPPRCLGRTIMVTIYMNLGCPKGVESARFTIIYFGINYWGNIYFVSTRLFWPLDN